jgi:predicted RNA-binding Zn-ribbon protein involved in translation (DUF1610 family)
MFDTDTEAADPGRPAHFECENCGTAMLATAVRYGPLGYPVCPECGRSTRPDR